MEWRKLEEATAGYGTVHLSSETVQRLREYSEDTYGARRINNRFGEGASPRLRQIREGLEALGINSDEVLHHAMPRLFYACALHHDSKEQLIGLREQRSRRLAKIDQIAEAWRRRWLFGRIQSDHILDQVAICNRDMLRSDLLATDDEWHFPAIDEG